MNRDDLLAFLNERGLGAVIGVIDAAITKDPTRFQGQFANQAVYRTIRDTPEYKQRFKGLALREQAGFPPITEDEYLKIEDDYRQQLRLNGMPKGFYDTQEDFANFIGRDVRADELGIRLQSGYRAVMEAEPGTKDELKRLYGLQDSDIAAFFLDPQRFRQSEAVRKAEAAQRATAAREQGITLSTQQAEEIAQRGISQAQARQGFQQIGMEQGLYAPQMVGEDTITQEEQIAGTFGTSAAAQQRIAQRRRRRQAEFEAGGTLAAGQTGIVGLRTAGQ